MLYCDLYLINSACGLGETCAGLAVFLLLLLNGGNLCGTAILSVTAKIASNVY